MGFEAEKGLVFAVRLHKRPLHARKPLVKERSLIYTLTMGRIMSSEAPEMVMLTYRLTDNQHTFKSEDYYGVYVASEDLREAYEMISEALEVIVKRRTGETLEYTPVLSYEQFSKYLGDSHEISGGIPHPSIIEAGNISYQRT